MSLYEILIVILCSLSIFLYIGCVLHYRDLKSAQEIVREVAYSGSSDGNAPYADMKAVLCFIADVVCIPDFRVNMAKSAVNVFYEYGIEAEFPRYFGRACKQDFLTYTSEERPAYWDDLSDMDVGIWFVETLQKDKIIQKFVTAYLDELIPVDRDDNVIDFPSA